MSLLPSDRDGRRRPDVERRAYSIDEFALAFSLSRTSVKRLLKSGELRSYRVGRRRLIPSSLVDEWALRKLAEAGEQTTPPQDAA
jgi:excisionase family DNA binding protein